MVADIHTGRIFCNISCTAAAGGSQRWMIRTESRRHRHLLLNTYLPTYLLVGMEPPVESRGQASRKVRLH